MKHQTKFLSAIFFNALRISDFLYYLIPNQNHLQTTNILPQHFSIIFFFFYILLLVQYSNSGRFFYMKTNINNQKYNNN